MSPSLERLVLSLALVLSSSAVVGLGGIGDWVPDWTLDGVPVQLIEVPLASPIGTGSCSGVRPGAAVLSDQGQCTLNFVFAGSDARTWVATAGHCILGESVFGEDAGETSWRPGEGPEARDASGARIGEFLYAILQDPKDFALVRVDPGVPSDPQLCHFGGPTGVNADTPSEPVVLHHYGEGVVVGSVVPARSGLAAGMPDPDHVFAQALAVPGDSGSAVIGSDGRAVGVIVTLGVHLSGVGTEGVDAGIVGITRIAPQLERAQQVLGIDFTLRTAPTL